MIVKIIIKNDICVYIMSNRYGTILLSPCKQETINYNNIKNILNQQKYFIKSINNIIADYSFEIHVIPFSNTDKKNFNYTY